MPLPNILVAPNGARRTTADHPALPVTIEQTVQTAKACFAAGADGIHAHLRDKDQKHLLDAGLYRELQAELALQVPDMWVQITTEAVDLYSPSQQRSLVRDANPKAVSISIREMLSEGESKEVFNFYWEQSEKGVEIQHILYDEQDSLTLARLINEHHLPSHNLQVLFVLGRYKNGQISHPEDLDPFLNSLSAYSPLTPDWGCCAFGKKETPCLLKALEKGGKARIGFENNLYHQDGTLAKDNADRVTELVKKIQESH
ncbi:MAG: 3-keto-5-aminohexanoate cleavage protein [Cohaesibacter sp.]|nr:3-keto-5-aminohexanoate cleavage protein [Cohaesibacter sp.]